MKSPSTHNRRNHIEELKPRHINHRENSGHTMENIIHVRYLDRHNYLDALKQLKGRSCVTASEYRIVVAHDLALEVKFSKTEA